MSSPKHYDLEELSMPGKPRELALLWLEKADHDLVTARQTLLLENGPTDTLRKCQTTPLKCGIQTIGLSLLATMPYRLWPLPRRW